MCAGHEVCTEQRKADGVSALGGKLQALLEHFFKRTAVEAAHTQKHRKSLLKSSSSYIFKPYLIFCLHVHVNMYLNVCLTRKWRGLTSPPACPPENPPSLCGR